MTSLKSLFVVLLAEAAIMQQETEDKIQEAIDKYWDACKYPRKKKKQLRKQAIKDYNFYMSLKKYGF